MASKKPNPGMLGTGAASNAGKAAMSRNARMKQMADEAMGAARSQRSPKKGK